VCGKGREKNIHILFVVVVLCFALRQSLAMQPMLTLNSLCSRGKPQIHHPPASASQVLGLQYPLLFMALKKKNPDSLGSF
jgi:hypothetical protein